MKPIPRGYVMTSSAFCITPPMVQSYQPVDCTPRVGDVMYGVIASLGAHRELENKSGRIHRLTDSTAAVLVYGNRYATDAFEALVPHEPANHVDLAARSGVIGKVEVRNSRVATPTTVRLLGQVHESEGQPLNTLDHSQVVPKTTEKKTPRSKLILVSGRLV